MEEVKKVHTPCRHCVFAEGYPTLVGAGEARTQTGCKLGRLEPFREQGGEDGVLEAYDERDNRFFIINGRLCNAYRDERSQWAQEPGHPVDRVQEELKLRLSVLVMLEEGCTEEQILATARSLKSQSLPPVEVHFVNNQAALRAGRINALLWQEIGSDLTWRITTIARDETATPSRERALDLAVEQATAGSYYAVFLAGFVVPTEFIAAVHRSLNERMERFSLLMPLADGNGLVVQQGLHRHPLVGGNEPVWVELEGEKLHLADIVAKVNHLAVMSEQPYMIRPVAEVVECLRS